MKRHIFLLLYFLFCVCPLHANNIDISNINLTEQSTSDHYTIVQFVLLWENSWRMSNDVPYNWDAVWVFVKYSTDNGATWNRPLNNAGNSSGSSTLATVQAGLR